MTFFLPIVLLLYAIAVAVMCLPKHAAGVQQARPHSLTVIERHWEKCRKTQTQAEEDVIELMEVGDPPKIIYVSPVLNYSRHALSIIV